MHKKNIQYIIDHGTNEQMEKMREILAEAVIKLKKFSPEEYNNIEFDLHKIAHSGHLGEDLAKQWVECMENKDGTKGAHWTWEQVSQVNRDKKIAEETADVYAILNMMYSDYYSPKFDVNTYVELAKDWFNDPDGSECKTLKYYYYIIHE